MRGVFVITKGEIYMQTVSYMGDGSTTEFNFNFPYYENTNIIVTKNNAPATGYQIVGTSGGADADIPYVGGKVVFEVAPTSLDNIIISRQLPLSRAIDYQPTAHIDPTTLNQDMNYMIEVLKDFLDELEIFHNQYAEIADKTSTQTLLSQIATINQMVADGEIMKVDKFHSCMTNCITEIPQDINLTLASGTLTLKAGSKVYVPNGSGNFDTVTTSADITANSPWGGGTDDVMLFVNGTSFTGIPATRCYSGSSQPTVSGGTDAYWYDTTNNVIKRTTDTGATWTTTTYSLPIAIFSRISGTITTIKQVFNGFGYMGAIIFTTPGVKGLIPNGYNNDGTLKNATFTTSGVLISGAITGTHSYSVRLNSNEITVGEFPYDTATNRNYNGTIAPGNERGQANVGTMKILANAIVSLRPKTAFHMADYTDSDFMAHQSMPSDKYLNLTLGATGATYTAPTDGYYTLSKAATASGQYINMINGSNGISSGTVATGAMDCRLFMPVSRGDVVTINYTTAGTTGVFRFVYANGAK